MIEEIFEALTGRWGIAALILFAFPTSRKVVRTVAKGVIRAGITATDQVKDMVAEVREEASDLMAEVQAERRERTKHAKT
ncbi:MAG: DUF5132 domain-containing protein [Candidatus Melainabacteria bacterium]|nr:DUF5132 domain-containing protein [Candidatus Melainabacteria bacterium]